MHPDMKRLFSLFALLVSFSLAPFGVAEAQYRMPYGEAHAVAPYAQHLDSAARETLRKGLMFDYGEFRKKRNAGMVLSLVGVSAEMVGAIMMAVNDEYDMPGASAAYFSGLTMACVGIPVWIVNGVRLNRTRRDYIYLMGRQLEDDLRSTNPVVRIEKK